MKKAFLITGIGRSGTKFLSNMLNKSTDYKVIHEIEGDSRYVEKPIADKALIKRFSRKLYGEVNSYMRFVSQDLNKKINLNTLYILRSPTEIALSCSFRRNKNKRQKYLNNISTFIYDYYYFIYNLNLKSNEILLFDKFTSNPEYIIEMENFLDINILDKNFIVNNIKKKINSSERKVSHISDAYDENSIKKIQRAEELYLQLRRVACHD